MEIVRVSSTGAGQIRQWSETIDRDGCAIIPRVFDAPAMQRIADEIVDALQKSNSSSESLRNRAGVVVAGRNLLAVYPAARHVWRVPPLMNLLAAQLGGRAGLVRALFFDKPPERTWSLPWHKDRTIAVANSRLPSPHFAKPTTKAGVPHVEAPQDLLSQMLTLRIHLDDVTADNGPLQVLVGSHRQTEDPATTDYEVRTVLLERGDVFAMRPLLTHRSIVGQAHSQQHRRTLHLEFCGVPILPDGYHWFEHTAVFKNESPAAR
jgi:hypothetical protein